MHPIIGSTKPLLACLPGGTEMESELLLKGSLSPRFNKFSNAILSIENLLSEEDILALLAIYYNAPNKEKVSALGRKDELNKNYTGSDRLTLWAPKLADKLFQLLIPFLSDRKFDEFSRTDFWQEPFSFNWRPIGLSPLLRMMSYPPAGLHLPHYDAAFFYPDARYRTLMSVLFYLTTHEDGGSTRILNDGQDRIPESLRMHQDRDYPAGEEEVLLKVYSRSGSVLLFDHRLYHDAEPCKEERILIRTDLVFEAI